MLLHTHQRSHRRAQIVVTVAITFGQFADHLFNLLAPSLTFMSPLVSLFASLIWIWLEEI